MLNVLHHFKISKPYEIGDELSELFLNILTFEAMITLFH